MIIIMMTTYNNKNTTTTTATILMAIIIYNIYFFSIVIMNQYHQRRLCLSASMPSPPTFPDSLCKGACRICIYPLYSKQVEQNGLENYDGGVHWVHVFNFGNNLRCIVGKSVTPPEISLWLNVGLCRNETGAKPSTYGTVKWLGALDIYAQDKSGCENPTYFPAWHLSPKSTEALCEGVPLLSESFRNRLDGNTGYEHISSGTEEQSKRGLFLKCCKALVDKWA